MSNPNLSSTTPDVLTSTTPGVLTSTTPTPPAERQGPGDPGQPNEPNQPNSPPQPNQDPGEIDIPTHRPVTEEPDAKNAGPTSPGDARFGDPSGSQRPQQEDRSRRQEQSR